jgi:hypothetical protein
VSLHPDGAGAVPDNQVEIQVIAGMRSGHHAIIHWLLCHFAGPVLFRNNPCGAEHFVYRNATDDYVRADAERRQPKDCYVFNLEDPTIEEAAALLAERRDYLAWGTSGKVYRLLVLRDLPNFIASRLKAEGATIPLFPCVDWSGLWASHAREFAGATETLPGLVKVSYNRWVTEEPYRRELAARLGLRFTDAGREHVSRIGAGSSFDGQRFDGRARDMAVLERYRQLGDDPELLAFTADPELRWLSALLFGIPEDPWRGSRPPTPWKPRRRAPYVRPPRR